MVNRPCIEMLDICKTYHMGGQEHMVLHNISFHVNSGSMLAIVGASGSGKSTLMNILGLLDMPCRGTYSLNGQDIANLSSDELALLRNKYIGFVFQQFHLLPRFTAAYNVALPLLYRRQPLQQALASAYQMLQRVGMAAYAEHRPMQLSGGQQQRVALARALVGEPQFILADEPTGALDSKTSHEIMQLLHELNQEGRTLIIVTHDENVAAQCNTRLIIADGQLVTSLAA